MRIVSWWLVMPVPRMVWLAGGFVGVVDLCLLDRI